jgi:hypothetical protein
MRYYSASEYLENVNQDQSYRSVKIEKSCRVEESWPVSRPGLLVSVNVVGASHVIFFNPYKLYASFFPIVFHAVLF